MVFSGNQLNRNIQNELSSKCKILSGKVNYSINSNLTGNPALAVKSLDTNVQEVVRAHFLMYWKELFLHKHPNWIYENEYRWLLHSAEEENHFVSIQNTLKAVIVGIDFPKKMETKLKALCQELNIPAGKMDWFNGIAYPKLQSIYEP